MIKRVVVTRAAENIIAGNSMILKKSMIRRIKSLTNDFNSWWDQKGNYKKWCPDKKWYLSPPSSSYFINFNFKDEGKD